MFLNALIVLVFFVCGGIWLFKAFSGKKETSSTNEEEHSEIQYGLFSDLESENIMFRASRKSHIETIIDIRGHVLDKKTGDINPILDLNGNIDLSQPPKPWLRNAMGLWWIGPPMFRQKYRFDIIKERINPKLNPDTEPENWIVQDKEVAHIYELRWKFPRPVFAPKVEFAGNVQANILILANFQVKNPYRAVFTQNARFFELIKSYIETAVNAYCNTRSFDEFRVVDKQIQSGKKHYTGMADPQGFSQFIVDNVNETLIEETGISITGAIVIRYDSSTQALQDALQAEELAKLHRNKALIEADENYQVTVKNAQAASEADNIRATNLVQDIKVIMDTFIEKGVHPDVAAQSAATIGDAERVRTMDNLTTLVRGDRANLAITPDSKRRS